MEIDFRTALGAFLALIMSAACSNRPSAGAGTVEAPAAEKPASMSKDKEDVDAYECANPHFYGLERERCLDRIKNCRGGMNSQSLICRRAIEELTYDVKPAEMVEVLGYIQRDGKSLSVSAAPERNSSSLQILGDSCLTPHGKDICTLKMGQKLRVIGAYFTERAGEGQPLQRKLLVLDVRDGDPGPREPIE